MVIDIKGYKVTVDEDAERVLAHKWWVSSGPDIDGRVICFSTKIDKKVIKLQRFIMGDPPGLVVDHCDGDRLNNRKSNLRACTVQQNNMNIGITRHNKSGYKGVSRAGKKWRATICLDGRQLHLGMFERPEIAAAAYDDAAELYFGDNRRLAEI
jgi:hypothetical protein